MGIMCWGGSLTPMVVSTDRHTVLAHCSSQLSHRIRGSEVRPLRSPPFPLSYGDLLSQLWWSATLHQILPCDPGWPCTSQSVQQPG